MPAATPGQRTTAAAVLELVAHSAGVQTREARSSPPRWTPEARAATADLAGLIAAQSMHAASELVAAVLAPELPSQDRRNLAAAAKDVAVVAGILTDKASLLAGLATSRIERIDADELRHRLAHLLAVPAVPLEANTQPHAAALAVDAVAPAAVPSAE